VSRARVLARTLLTLISDDRAKSNSKKLTIVAASVQMINTYMEESLATFRVSLTEALMGSTEKMMRSFSEPIGYSKKEKKHKRSGN